MKKQGRFYEIDGLKLPSVTTVMSAIAKPALINWASYGARDATLEAAAAVYQIAGTLSPTSFKAAVLKYLGRGPAHTSPLAKGGDAADIGTLVHARIEAEMRHELGEDVAVPEIPEEEIYDGKVRPHPARVSYQSYLEWRKTAEVKPISAELRVYSKRLGYAGTVDLLAHVEDVLSIVDYKTSKAVYGEYRLQIAAYRAAWIEMQGGALPEGQLGGLILRFPKDAPPKDNFEVVSIGWDEQDELMDVFLASKRIWEWQE